MSRDADVARLRRLLVADGSGVSALVALAIGARIKHRGASQRGENENAAVGLVGLALAIAAVLMATRTTEGERISRQRIPLALISAGATVNTIGAFGVVSRPGASRAVRMSGILLLIGGDIVSVGYARELARL